jgi:hypothetical protein
MRKDPTLNQQQLGNLLLRYKNHFKAPQATVERLCIDIVKEVLEVDLQPQQVIYTPSTQTIIFKTPSILTSEIKTHHIKILEELQKRLDNSSLPKHLI